MQGRVVIVTGANSGIGLETAAGLTEMGAKVIVTTRDPNKSKTTVEEIRSRHPSASVEAMELDLARLDDVRRFARDFAGRGEPLHVLVNNAGLITDRRSTTVDGYETQFHVNHLGPFLLTNLLLDKLKSSAPARVVNVASAAHRGGRINFDDLHSERSYRAMGVYSMTKLCNILFTRELARRLEGSGVSANALHPGTVRTNFTGGGDVKGLLAVGFKLISPFILSPAKGARTSIYLASSPDVEGRSGEYFVRCRAQRPSRAAQDDDDARRLWEASARLVGLPDQS
jgi:NAD(P)-dependent dehydrogenase (short-subunit alcohol dehydrogenase family)